QPAAFMRRRILEKVGWLYPAWCHDHDLWLRIARAGGVFDRISARLAVDRLRLDNLGRVAEIVVPGKIGLTKRFFAEPALPREVRRLRRRAMSSAYLRALDYLRGDHPRHWLWAVSLVTRAVLADPRNIRAISKRALGPARARGSRVAAALWSLVRAIGRVLVRVAAFPWKLSRRVSGWIVDRAFTRANRQLELKVERARRRMEQRQDKIAVALTQLRHDQKTRLRALRQAVLDGLQPLAERIDRLAADIPQLANGIEQDHSGIRGAFDELHQHEEKLDAVERAVPKALRPVATRIDRIGADILQLAESLGQDRSRVQEALESLRHQHEVRLQAIEQAVPTALQPLTTRIDRMAAEALELADGVERDRQEIRDALKSLQHLEAARERPATLSDAFHDVYGTPPTLRRIPGWHTYWGIQEEPDPLLRSRVELWSSLKRPVVMRWLGDLLVTIRPGNELSRVLFLTGNFEPNELMWLTQTLTEGMTMLDIGAHVGMYSLIASKLVGDSGVVVAMEPSTREFQQLSVHMALNDLRNVRCVHAAASDASGEATLKVASEWNSGHNTFGEFFVDSVEKTGEERVRTRTVDEVVIDQQLQRVDVIKIDVEGHEVKVLAGAAETLARFRPTLLIEVFEETLRRQGASATAVLAFLERQGYRLQEFSDTTGELVPLQRSLGNESRNLVALPE
ncbi:MAG TPA: FkbM family methyltransferase, partial [Gemmatimonadales bacterium]|nr:FkbM family methyltransferase [Gemmatimonadales bacterium]